MRWSALCASSSFHLFFALLAPIVPTQLRDDQAAIGGQAIVGYSIAAARGRRSHLQRFGCTRQRVNSHTSG